MVEERSGHRLGCQGGRVSQDVTGGYGPEEFALKVAKPGMYTVQAQFYGRRQQVLASAITLMLRLTTGFGRAEQNGRAGHAAARRAIVAGHSGFV